MAERLTLGDLVYRLGFESEDAFVRQLEQVMRRGERSAEEGGRQAGRSWTEQFKATFSAAALGSFIGGIFAQAFTRAGAEVQRFFRDSIQAASQFEARLSNIATLGANNAEQMAELRDGLLALGPAVGEGPARLAEGLYDIVSAGFAGQDALQVLEASARAARAGLTDTGTAADAVTTALNAYGLRASEATRITDALQTTVALGKTTWDELGSSIGQVIPIAASVGVEIEELGAALAAMTGQGIKTSQAVTGLRSTLVAILNPSAQARRLAADLGIEFNAQALRAKGLAGVLEDVRRATGGNEEQMATLLGSVEALNAVLALTSESGAARFRDGQEAMREAAGATDVAFRQQMSTAEAAEARFRAAMEAVKIAVGEQFTPSITSAKNLFADFALGFMRQSGEVAATANQDMLSVGRAFRDAAEAIWGALDSAGAAVAEFVVWFDFHRRGIEIGAESTAERLGAFFGRMVHAVTSSVTTALERVSAAIDEAAAAAARGFGWLERNAASRGGSFGVGGEGGGAGGVSGGRGRIETPIDQPARPTTATPPPPLPEPPAPISSVPARATMPTSSVPARADMPTRVPSAPTDALVDEADRIRAHVDYLQALRASDRMDAAAYEEWLQAHLRRLGGMYERATTQEQRVAILRTERQVMQELERLAREAEAAERERLERQLAAQREYQQSRQAALEEQLVREAEAREAALEQERRQLRQLAVRAGVPELVTEIAGADAQRLRAIEAAIRTIDSLNAATRRGEEDAARRAAAEERVNQALAARDRILSSHEAVASRVAEADAQRAAEAEAAERRRQEAILRRQAIQAGAPSLAAMIGPDTDLAAIEAAIRTIDSLNAATKRGLEQAEERLARQREANARQVALAEEARDRIVSSHEAATASAGQYVTLLERAQGVVVRYTAAQLELGHATREELVAALQEQIRAIELIAARIPRNTALYEQLAAAIRRARGELERLTREAEPAPAATISDYEQALGGLERDLTRVMMSLPAALVEGIRQGDIVGALSQAVGSAADYFVTRMIQGILGPIAEQLAASVARSMLVPGGGGGAALGPLGIALGLGGLLFGAISSGLARQRTSPGERAAAERALSLSSAPAITYNLTANVTVNARADWSDPAFHQRWRAETEALVTDMLRRARS